MTYRNDVPKFQTPHIGFAADAHAFEEQNRSGKNRYTVHHDWPDITIGRSVGRLDKPWDKFGKALLRSSQAIGEPVMPAMMKVDYVEPSAMNTLLTRLYPGIAKDPDDRLREQTAQSFVDKFNSAVERRRRYRSAFELEFLVGENKYSLPEQIEQVRLIDLPEQVRQATSRDFEDAINDDDSAPAYQPGLWSATQFEFNIEAGAANQFGFDLIDPEGIIETERRTVSEILSADLKVKCPVQTTVAAPFIEILRTYRAISEQPYMALPELNADVIPLGPPQASIG